MSESTSIISRVEQHLKGSPPDADKALKELEPLLKAEVSDPRVFLLVGLALAMTNQKAEAKKFATLARDVAGDIQAEAAALVEKLS